MQHQIFYMWKLYITIFNQSWTSFINSPDMLNNKQDKNMQNH